MKPVEEGFTWTCIAGHEVSAAFSDALAELRRTVTESRPVELYCLQCGGARVGLGLPTVAREGFTRAKVGGEAGIRTLGTTLRSYNGLANRRFRPLSHLTAT